MVSSREHYIKDRKQKQLVLPKYFQKTLFWLLILKYNIVLIYPKI